MGSSGGPGKIDNLNYGGQLESMAQANDARGAKLYRSAAPLYNEQVGQTLEALKTGGVGAQIPVIQRAVEQSKIATSGAVSSAQDRARGAGLAGTPFGQRAVSDTATAGALATSRIPTEIASRFISNAGNVSGQGFQAGQGYSTLGANTMGNLQSMDLQRQMANAAQFQAFMNSLYGGASQATSMGSMCLHPDTPIETPRGDVAVDELHVGDRVWTADAMGARVEARITAARNIEVAPTHSLALVRCPRGHAWITPAHPRPDGTPVADHAAGVAGGITHTRDLAVSGPTGVYFVLGLALGSTLDPRFVRAAEVA